MAGFDNLNPVFASRLQAMIQAAAAEGRTIGIGSGHRTVEEQIQLRIKNGCPDVWSSPASSCRVPTAIPGRSNHNVGLAADITGDKDWANANAHRFGLAFNVSGEDWHVELAGDDAALAAASAAGGPMSFNMQWAEEQRNPEDELTSRLDQIMAIVGGGAPETGQPEDVLRDELRQDVTTIPGAPGAAGAMPQGGTGNAFGDYALAQFQKYGWGPEELQALTVLWNRESGDPKADTITWRPDAKNPTSSAAGIAQKMQSVHGPVEADWQGQINWGLGYIAERYGSPSAALAAHNEKGWY